MSNYKFVTEKVRQPRQLSDGEVVEDIFWIAYSPEIEAYGKTSDRISRCNGVGALKRDALDSALTNGRWVNSGVPKHHFDFLLEAS